MSGLEKKDQKENAGVKVLQYVMLAALFGAAFFLPRYAGQMQVQEAAKQERILSADRADDGVIDMAMLQSDESNGESGMTITLEDKKNGATGVAQRKLAEKGTIVLDSGHGGDDPGMIGVSGSKEKELNLIYTKKLAALLEQAGYRVVLTRDCDEGLYDASAMNKKAQDMQRRCEIIEREAPLVTVSIHQNSYPQDASVRGPQVFYYEHSAEGEKLAKYIQDSMNAQLEVARPRVQKGNATYYILKRSPGVTVIVECGFLTNPQEEALLQEEEYQDRMARAMCDGVLAYLDL